MEGGSLVEEREERKSPGTDLLVRACCWVADREEFGHILPECLKDSRRELAAIDIGDRRSEPSPSRWE